MKSKVYFIPVKDSDPKDCVREKFKHLIQQSGVFDFIRKQYTVAIKLHFGEEGNTGFVKPEYVRAAVDKIFEKGAKPVLSDTNTLYRGRRVFSDDHLKLAYEHGFTLNIAGAPVFIPDDLLEQETSKITINGKNIKVAKVASFFLKADALVGIAHFKGHIMTSFGGALKNIGMGCASREGKLQQHSDVSPDLKTPECRGCGECQKVCPVKAIVIIDKKAHLDAKKCIGCASCIAACKFNTIEINWEAGGRNIQEKMAEYASAVLLGKKERAVFVNFAIKITQECDCLAKDDPKISPDVGILASTDPVSIDQASLDLVIDACGKDIFKEAHPNRDGTLQLSYANKLGLGSLDYELIRL